LNYHGKVTPAERKAAAKRFQAAVDEAQAAGATASATLVPDPNTGYLVPDYFGVANWAYSPLPNGGVGTIEIASGGSGYTAPSVTITDVYGIGTGATATATVTGGVITAISVNTPGSEYYAPVVSISDATGTGASATATFDPTTLTGGIRKFMDALPGLGAGAANLLGQYIPTALPDTTTYPGSDYYEIALVEYTEQMHTDLPPTTHRGYVQEVNGVAVDTPHFLGPVIVSTRDRPVRIKFTNRLPVGEAGDLFVPVDTTVMGAGMGPLGMAAMPMDYTQNRADVHLHGNNTVWISDGTPHQWITPAGEDTPYPQGVSVVNVPDMANVDDPRDGVATLYYTNAQSARLMFYHDHSYGITRLNVYVGEAAGYLITDRVEQDLINGTNNSGVNPGLLKVLPDLGIPLVIQDRTFVDDATILATDPTWAWGTGALDPNTGFPTPKTGDLWYPHVYVPAQNPYDLTGANAFGRWHYGPWFWPPTTDITYGPVPNPYYDPDNAPWEPPMMPGTPNPSMPGEAFMDTPIVNGTLYPYLEVEPKAYRFRILNAADDRFFNLQLYEADPAVTTADGRANTEVKMVPATGTPGIPADFPSGVPDPTTRGPDWIQIGTEGGFLPAPAVIPSQPITWNLNPTSFNFGNVDQHSLLVGTAERADVIVDFSQYAGKTLLLYNDAPAAFPALDPRYDYYTGDPDQTDTGGAPSTQAGYGPNTRTIMQIRVGMDVTTPTPNVTLANLQAVFAKTGTKPGVFERSQDDIIMPQAAYNSAYNATFPTDPTKQYVQLAEFTKTFQPINSTGALLPPVTLPLEPKAIQDEMGEAFDTEYGRMSGMLGLELPTSSAAAQQFQLYGYASPPVDLIKGTTDLSAVQIGALNDGTQIWKINHNGVDTHTIHTHLFNAQLINRVAWDGAMLPPDPNELGWKETFRVNPLEQTVIAMRPSIPTLAQVPFLNQIPNSVRLIDPTMPEGALLEPPPPAGFFDPLGNPVASIVNHYVNLGWEYVYHCHILAHEEMDMMHALAFVVPPAAPSNLAATVTGIGSNRRAILTWTQNSLNATGFTVQRANNVSFTTGLVTVPLGKVTTYTDPIGITNQVFYYRVFASNTVGDAATPGFPTMSSDSPFSNTVTVGTPPVTRPPAAPSILRVTALTRTSVALAWRDNSNNEDGFLIQRTTLSPFGQAPRTFTVGANVTAFTDTTVAPNSLYYYRVRAFNAAGNSVLSNLVLVRTPR
jgi:FtsP/CotA-like multicopper oxidase with cupredoxin domain